MLTQSRDTSVHPTDNDPQAQLTVHGVDLHFYKIDQRGALHDDFDRLRPVEAAHIAVFLALSESASGVQGSCKSEVVGSRDANTRHRVLEDLRIRPKRATKTACGMHSHVSSVRSSEVNKQYFTERYPPAQLKDSNERVSRSKREARCALLLTVSGKRAAVPHLLRCTYVATTGVSHVEVIHQDTQVLAASLLCVLDINSLHSASQGRQAK